MRIQSILILLVATAAPFISSSLSEPVATELGKVQGRELRHVNKNQPEGDIIEPDLKGIEVVPMTDSPQLSLSRPCCCQCTAPPCKCSCKEPMDTKKGGYLNINDITAEAEKKAAPKKKRERRKQAKHIRKEQAAEAEAAAADDGVHHRNLQVVTDEEPTLYVERKVPQPFLLCCCECYDFPCECECQSC